jgi:hypothetical protein
MSSSGPVGMRLNLVAVERHLKPKHRAVVRRTGRPRLPAGFIAD